MEVTTALFIYCQRKRGKHFCNHSVSSRIRDRW